MVVVDGTASADADAVPPGAGGRPRLAVVVGKAVGTGRRVVTGRDVVRRLVLGCAERGSFFAGGRETLVGGSPEPTDTMELLYTSPTGIDSSLRNDT